MKPSFDVSVNLVTRPAFYTPNKYRAAALKVDEGTVLKVDVFGVFQVASEEDVDAYFVVELPDGTCTYAAVTEIRFDKEAEARCEQ